MSLSILSPVRAENRSLLSDEALRFLERLTGEFRGQLEELMLRRRETQHAFDRGERPAFRSATRPIREREWKVAPPPADLERRVVEITGPPDRKMVIHALNSGADVFMADFEDATSPTLANLLDGQRNLYDAVRRTIAFEDSARGKTHTLGERPATLMVRPRGWHLPEKHVAFEGQPMPGSLFDFGLYFFHNAAELIERGSGPYFYLPKLESHREARLWNEVFRFSQHALGIPLGTIRATVLIETLPAAFAMHEILYALRDHSAGLNCGRWDYIFSFIKVHREDRGAVLPDRAEVGMTQPFLRAYTQLAVQTCHRRGAHSIGGMAAQIPIKDDSQANDRALAAVRSDKSREARDGHDGTWVAHPALVPVARAEFDKVLGGRPHQLEVERSEVRVAQEDLLRVPEGSRTERGLRHDVNVGIRYLTAWLSGQGCVPIQHLMEDAATAEISRAQVWQWCRHGAKLNDGRTIDVALLRTLIAEELAHIQKDTAPNRHTALRSAGGLFTELVESSSLIDFLTLPAYERLLAAEETEYA